MTQYIYVHSFSNPKVWIQPLLFSAASLTSHGLTYQTYNVEKPCIIFQKDKHQEAISDTCHLACHQESVNGCSLVSYENGMKRFLYRLTATCIICAFDIPMRLLLAFMNVSRRLSRCCVQRRPANHAIDMALFSFSGWFLRIQTPPVNNSLYFQASYQWLP